MMQTNRLQRQPLPSHLAQDINELQLLIQEISDIISDREQVIDSLTQEIHHLHERIDGLEQQNMHVHRKPMHHIDFSNRRQNGPNIYGDMYSNSRQTQESVDPSSIQAIQEVMLSDTFISQLSKRVQDSLSSTLQQSSLQPVVHHVHSTHMPSKNQTHHLQKKQTSKKTSIKHNLKKKSAPEHAFRLANGLIIHSIHDLVETIEHSSEDWFLAHVRSDGNDFAHWIRDVFKNKELAKKVATVKTKNEFLALFKE